MNELATAAGRQGSLVIAFAERMGVKPDQMLPILKRTAFKVPADKEISNEQMAALLIVAQQYKLNPFTRELFAFPDKAGGIVPYVSVDGWARIVNEHPQFDGMEFEYDSEEQSFSCTIHRKDRRVPTTITEYMSECKRGTDPWNKSPRRMLRHKALMQCARVTFGFAIYDQDEAELISSGEVERVEPPSQSAQRLRAALSHSPVPPDQARELEPERAAAARVDWLLKSIRGAEDFADLADARDRVDALPDDSPDKPVLVEQLEHREKILSRELDPLLDAPAPRFDPEKYEIEIRSATDAETAALVMDEARSTAISPDELRKLADIYRECWVKE